MPRSQRSPCGDLSKPLCRGRLARYKIPRYVQVRGSFPMTVSGKIRKVQMRQEIVEELGPGAAVTTASVLPSGASLRALAAPVIFRCQPGTVGLLAESAEDQ
ncbi:hypothetical protein ABIB35_000213 [Arthrobacter sp. UYP6]